MKNNLDEIECKSIIDKEISEDAAILQKVKLPDYSKKYTLFI